MNQRERMLTLVLVAVGGLGVILVGYMGYSAVNGWIQGGKNRIATLEKQLAEKKRLVAQTNAAKGKISDWQHRSLPPEPSLASSLYGDWLLDRVVQARFSDPKLVVGNQVPERDLCVRLAFTISGKGTLRQIVELLYEIYSVDHLHRVTLLKIQPTKEPKQLSLTMTVEVLSMLGAPEATELASRPGKRLELSTQEDYLNPILTRSLFGDPNQPPQLTGLGSKSATTGERFFATPGVSDPDVGDKHTFKLERSDVEEARFDSSSGSVSFTPLRPGTYEFQISATDNGYPPLTTTERLTVSVSDPPPPPDPPVRTLAFDEAKFTVLAALIDKGGVGHVWLHVRPRESNSMLKLSVGDEFEIGSVKGTIKAIDTAATHILFESDGQVRKLASGQALTSAQVIEAAVSLPADQPSPSE